MRSLYDLALWQQHNAKSAISPPIAKKQYIPNYQHRLSHDLVNSLFTTDEALR
ncbi:MAG: hypothetical protein PUP93_04440 [Rhizonema sp. NSF051]|nr:hypothetical protein [Rhizonema sp. NSF051]